MEDRLEEIKNTVENTNWNKKIDQFSVKSDMEYLIQEVERLQTIEQAYRALKSSL